MTIFFLLSICIDVWKDLVEVLRIIDDFCNKDTTIASELDHLHAVEPLPGDNFVFVESPHSYLPNTLDEKLVSMPGADFLVLQFDERCNTERGQDYLELCLTDGTPICSELHGPPPEWNKTPLIIHYSEIVFRFTSGLSGAQSRNYWGYGCLVTGIKFGHYPNHSIMLDLLHTTANVVGKVSIFFQCFFLCYNKNTNNDKTNVDTIVMVGPEPDDIEKAHSKWLTSPLFSRGREKHILEEKSEKDKDDSKEKELKKQENVNVERNETVDSSNDVNPFSKSPVSSWSQVPSHQEFLGDLALMKADSKAMAFSRKMFDQLKKEVTDRMGGKIVDQTIHFAIAAIMKHLGLVEIATKFALSADSVSSLAFAFTPNHLQSQWNQKLLFVFKLAKRLRQWIVNEKQTLQQDHERMIIEASEKGKELGTHQIKTSEEKATYEGLCNEMIEKAKFLLSMRPYCPMYMEGLTSDEEVQDFSFTVQISKLQSMERQASDIKSEFESWKAAFSTWQTLNTMIFHKKLKKENLGQQISLPDLIVTFIQSSTPLQTYLRLVETHQKRGSLRGTVLQTLLELIDIRELDELKMIDKLSGKRQKSLKSLSAKITVIGEWRCPLREFGDKDGPKTDHFLSHIESCGEVIEKSVRKNWEALYEYFTHLIRSPIAPLSLKQQALNSWAVVLTQGEEVFVSNCKVIDLLHDILAQYILILDKVWSAGADKTKVSSTMINEAKSDSTDNNKPAIQALFPSIGIDWTILSPHQKDATLRLVECLCTLLSMVLVGFHPQGTKVASPPTPNNLNLQNLQLCILSHLHNEVKDHIFLLSSAREKGHTNAHSQVPGDESLIWDTQADVRFVMTEFDRNFLEIEELCYKQLVEIRALTYHANNTAQSFLKSKKFLQTLVDSLTHGSPRIKRLAVVILRDILQFLSPAESTELDLLSILQSQPPKQSSTAESKEPEKKTLSALQFLNETQSMMEEESHGHKSSPLDLINYLLETAGSLLLVHDDYASKNLKSEWSALDHTLRLSAEVKRDLGLEFIMLVRSLIQAPNWRHLVTGGIYETLKQASDIIDLENGAIVKEQLGGPDNSTLANTENNGLASQTYLQVKRLVGCLGVLGGHIDRLRPGCRVELKINEEEDDHMIERGFCLSVSRSTGLCSVLFDNVKKPVTIEIKKVSSKSEINPLGCIPVTRELLSNFAIFTQPIHMDTRDPRKISSRPATENKAPASSTTEAKPVQTNEKVVDAPVEEEPLPTTWECPICTLVNPMVLSACEACQTPNPTPSQRTAPSQQRSFEISQFSSTGNNENEAKEEKGIDIPQMVPEPALEQLLFYQLRSLGLKALCCLLQQPEATKLILEEKQGLEKILPHLLSIATRPVDLDQYRSVEFLEEQEDRLLEILHDKPLNLEDRIPKSAAQMTQKQLLKFSPFRTLQVHLPSRLDTESASGVIFSRSHEFRIMFKKTHNNMVGYCRTNNLIPLSIPGYYFEVKILKLGNISNENKDNNAPPDDSVTRDEKSWKIAVGLWRAGMNFQGDCGDQNSYAYGATGYAYSTVSRKRVSLDLEEDFGEGDVVGVGWDQRERAIYFTKNGVLLGSKSWFDEVNGQFYPMIWLQADGAQVSVNLGQEAMSFNIEELLGASELQKLKNENQVQYSEAEIQRRTMAEELVRMMGDIFPLEFAVVTLEQCHDDMAMAADYLVNNASRELDRIAQNLSRNNPQEDDGLQPQDEIKDDNKNADADDEQTGLMAFIANNLDDAAGGDNVGRGGRAGGENLLEDEVDAQLPVGLTVEEIAANANFRNQEQAENQHRRAPANEEDDNSRRQIGIGSRLRQQLPPIQIQKILPGQHLSIWSDAHRICHELWQKDWKRLQGKTGIVQSVDVNNS
ncbi:hypothetical protein RFI_23084 [Reticulomyxa filosa]|uniref:HECT E3 ubiquitin ligase n=1 Tax=Reticulomyxa filosa TaxID=46433 RepID=X6MMH8_RETFI|nr:hypothetical protein RFI_23084 [Reticulomyxa filosa]|eukprot:ETO14285.1 hypothetical protein RFI_23084 [Reticulomyxa filosa]